MTTPETGLPDAWIRLWTPHRGQYLHDVRSDGTVEQECPFCSAPKVSEEDSLVVFKGKLNYVVLNLYPYNAGHLLVAPFRHFADFTSITDEESNEMQEITRKAMLVLRKASGAQGFNIGMNQGSVAGTSVADHLHQHIVPRWGGDTNFMPIIGRAKSIPQLLKDTQILLAKAWIE
ncbi:MAG: HIT domain-containing protein [Actinomycetota bacterium]|nr:HIT domain-containing protein [Actinomycetota bacterium]